MADTLILGLLDEALNELGAQPLVDASASVDLRWLRGAALTDLVVRHEGSSLVAEATVLIDADGAQLLSLGPLAVALAPPPTLNRPLLVRITLGAAPSIDLYDLRLMVDLAQPWLHRVDPVTWAPSNEPFRFEVEGRVRLAADGATDCECFGLTLPPFEIGRSGIVITLDDCRPAIDGVGIPISVRDVLTNTGASRLDGLYARCARLHWLPQFRFPEAPLPGFGFNFKDVLLDASGVSFTVDETWAVERLAGAPHRLSPRSAMFGRLFDGRLRVALERAAGTVQQNVPVDFALDGWIEVAAFDVLLHTHFYAHRDPQLDDGLIGLTLTQQANTQARVNLGIGEITIENLSSEGLLTNDGLSVTGEADLAIDLPAWQSGNVKLELDLAVGRDATSLSVALRDVGLGPLGILATATFDVRFATDESGNVRLEWFAVLAKVVWGQVSAQLGFDDLPPDLPVPSDDAELTAAVQWTEDGGLTLRLEGSAGDVTNAFAFLPAPFRPEVRSISFGFQASFPRAEDFFNDAPGAPIAGEVFANVSFRPALPDVLRDNGVVMLYAGDADGFVDAALRAVVQADGSAQLSMSIESPIALEVAIPGITDRPMFTAALTDATMQLANDSGDNTSATIEFTGEFAVLPASLTVSSLMGPQLAGFLEPLTSLALEGAVTATLELADGRAALTLLAEMAGAEIDLDLFDQIGRLGAGPGAGQRAPRPAQRQAQQELDIDLSFQFALDSLAIHVGELEDSSGDSIPASIELRFVTGINGATLPLFVRVSTEELIIGVEGAEIPLQLPRFPLAPEDLQPAVGADGQWSRPELDGLVADLRADAASVTGNGRQAAGARGMLVAKGSLLEFVRDTWVSLSADDARRRYQDGVTALITVVDDLSQLTHTESDVRLEIGSARLRIPFADPSETAVEGGATLRGFADDDPLFGLNELTLRLGLSPDQIYFALEGSGHPILLPPVGRYSKGSISLAQLAIGYGFTKNSLAVAFAGELVYPKQLTDDLNTSEVVGFGVKLPRYNRLAFRLDVIPVPGPIPVVPLLEFSIDLRTPGLPALRGTRPCEPYFDGLELDVPGIIRADVKAIALSPMLGIIPAVNVRFDGDLRVGNDAFGVTIICDNLLWLAGVGSAPSPLPIPFLIDPAAPYFDHLCVNVRFAGFGINFDLERPFPLPNPLLIFEVLALIADPLAPIKPDGPLARSMRIALNDAYVSIPAWARPLIPGGAALVREKIDFELNVGTLMGAAQWAARTAGPLMSQVQDAFEAGTAALDRLSTHPPRVDPGELLALLPPELRVVHAELSFAGFEASATFVLLTPVDATRGDASIDTVWQLQSLRGFSRADMAALPALAGGVTAVLTVAQIDLFGVFAARFFGQLADDGSFALVTAVNARNPRVVPLRINGIDVDLPFKFSGRLRLEGQVNASRRVAAIRVQGSGTWDILPGVVQVAAGLKKPVELRIESTGRFALAGDGLVRFFGDTLRITGALAATESSLMVSGELGLELGGTPRKPAVALRAGGALHIGPGSKWGFDGAGVLRLFDLNIVDTSVRLSDREVAVHAAIKRTVWRVGKLKFDSHLSGDLDGRFVYASDPQRAQSPQLRLRGRGTIEALGAKLRGSLAIDADEATLSAVAEGDLWWFDKRWFAARLALASDGSLELAGRTSVVLDLTPRNLGIQVASLFLRAELSAQFGFNARGGKLSHAIDIDWSLGVRLPGGKPSQTFVLAMQKVHIAPQQALDLELVHVQGMNFIPMSDIVIPIPVITTSGSEQFIRARLRIPVIDQARFLMTDGLKDWLEGQFGDDFVFGRRELFKVPKNLKVEVEDHRLGDLAASFSFRVRLRWKTNQLGFEIRRGKERSFISLDQLL